MAVPPWDEVYHFYDGGEKTVAYFLVLDSINFCFWPASGKERWEIEYRNETLSGYIAMAAALKQATEDGVPITRAGYLAEMSLDQLTNILRGRGTLQLLEQRLQILQEVGRVLLEKYDGAASALVEASSGSAVGVVTLLGEHFESFRDEAIYRGRRVYFYKRAQIFVADLHGAFEGKRWGHFKDINMLTAFADYKVPQVLRHFGILRYSTELEQRIDRGGFLEAGSPAEVEIRANTIWAVELIRQAFEKVGNYLNAFEIDWFLWNMGQRSESRKKPYHKTVTIYY
jgi:hypothetical protein